MATLISVECPAFVGKTSLVIPVLQSVLKTAGLQVKYGHELKWSKGAKAFAHNIYERARNGASQYELASLFNQALKIHIEGNIVPFAGEQRENTGVFLMDRFAASTMVFQGIEGKVPIKTLIEMEQETVGSFAPDVYVILYFPDANFERIIKARKSVQDGNKDSRTTVWHQSNVGIQKLRRDGYASLPELYTKYDLKRNFVYVDVSQHPFQVAIDCIKAITPSLSPQETTVIGSEPLRKLLQHFETFYTDGGIKNVEKCWQQQQILLAQ